jgi:hypothetical protein
MNGPEYGAILFVIFFRAKVRNDIIYPSLKRRGGSLDFSWDFEL